MYNSSAFIPTALASVLAQSVPVDEIIIVDDGSTDDSVRVAESCLVGCGIPFHIFELEHTGAVSVARNFGLSKSSSQLVAFLDADDFWHPDKLGWVRSTFDGSPQVALVYHSMALVKQVGSVTPRRALRAGRAPKSQDELFRRAPNIPFSSCVVRRNAVLDVGGFAADLSIAEDLDLWFRLLANGHSFVRGRRLLGSYVLRSGSASALSPTEETIELLPKRWGYTEPLPWWVYVNLGERSQRQHRTREALAFYRQGLVRSRKTVRGACILLLKFSYCALSTAFRPLRKRADVWKHVS